MHVIFLTNRIPLYPQILCAMFIDLSASSDTMFHQPTIRGLFLSPDHRVKCDLVNTLQIYNLFLQKHQTNIKNTWQKASLGNWNLRIVRLKGHALFQKETMYNNGTFDGSLMKFVASIILLPKKYIKYYLDIF